MLEVKPWSAPRMWKGKPAEIYLRETGKADIYRADFYTPSGELGAAAFTVYLPTEHSITDEDGIGIHTDKRYDPHVDRRFMAEGVANGLEDRPTYLAGRFIITKAISLVVHLGASSIVLYGTDLVDDRAKRNLATMVRPLKGRRVRVFDAGDCLGLFPPFGLEE